MRATLAMFVFVTGLFILTTAEDIRNLQRFFTLKPRNVFLKHRTKLRDSCGFKPNQMSTAIGFGKRYVSRLLPRIISEDMTPEEALIIMMKERFQEKLPEDHPFLERLHRQQEIADKERTNLIEERKLMSQNNEGNEEQPMMMGFP